MSSTRIITQGEVREHASLEVHTVGYREFAPTRDCVREVRHFVKETLERVGLDKDSVFELQLIADELAANAVLHAGSVFSVAIELTEEVVRIAVRDDSNSPPVAQPATAESGRGLVIVSGTASGWGSASLGRGKEIWADLDRTSD